MATDASPSSSPNAPLSNAALTTITADACTSTFSSATHYEHANTKAWNETLIDTILKTILIQQQSTTTSNPYSHKYAITSTIIQHTNPSERESGEVGRRGMHSATGAFWNNATDGMWSYKYEGGVGKGFDVVVQVLWFGNGV